MYEYSFTCIALADMLDQAGRELEKNGYSVTEKAGIRRTYIRESEDGQRLKAEMVIESCALVIRSDEYLNHIFDKIAEKEDAYQKKGMKGQLVGGGVGFALGIVFKILKIVIIIAAIVILALLLNIVFEIGRASLG